MRAAADALRKIDSVHVDAAGKDISFDLRLAVPDKSTGTISSKGIKADIIRVGGATYVRYGDTLPAEAEGRIEPHQWTYVTGSGQFNDITIEFGSITIATLADEISGEADTAKPEVHRTTEAGQPALLAETASGFKLWVSNVGPPLPLREIDENSIDGTFTEYDAKVDIKAPPAGEVRGLTHALAS